MRNEELIAQMAARATPVRRLAPPARRAVTWLGVALLLAAGVFAWHGPRPNLAEQLASPGMVIPWLVSILTGVLAIFAAFHLAQPDRSGRWLWLPVPALAVWIGTLGLGCLAAWLENGARGLVLEPGTDCLRPIALASVPLALVLLFLLRHAGPVRPLSTTVTGALAVSSFSSAAMELFHESDAALTVLVWHVGTVVILTALFLLVARPLMRLLGPRPAAFAR